MLWARTTSSGSLLHDSVHPIGVVVQGETRLARVRSDSPVVRRRSSGLSCFFEQRRLLLHAGHHGVAPRGVEPRGDRAGQQRGHRRAVGAADPGPPMPAIPGALSRPGSTCTLLYAPSRPGAWRRRHAAQPDLRRSDSAARTSAWAAEDALHFVVGQGAIIARLPAPMPSGRRSPTFSVSTLIGNEPARQSRHTMSSPRARDQDTSVSWVCSRKCGPARGSTRAREAEAVARRSGEGQHLQADEVPAAFEILLDELSGRSAR